MMLNGEADLEIWNAKMLEKGNVTDARRRKVMGNKINQTGWMRTSSIRQTCGS
jgi:hypothetical protein